jgi:hypothetical protein
MEATTVRPGYELWRPNREKTESQTTKALVSFVLLVSAGVILVITIGGWERLQGFGVGVMSLIYALLYIAFAFLVARWNRGILPVAAALAIVLAIFAGVAAPGWFARAKDGLDSPLLPEELLGLLTLLLVPVQLLLITIAMMGFNQEWQVEEERPVGAEPHHGYDDEEDTAYVEEQPVEAGEPEPEPPDPESPPPQAPPPPQDPPPQQPGPQDTPGT